MLKNDSFVTYCSRSDSRRLGRAGSQSEWELCFIKDDMAGCDNTSTLEIKAMIATVICRIAKKHAWHGPRA